MLLKLLKAMADARAAGSSFTPEESPIERVKRIGQAHRRAPIDLHRDILFRNLSIGDRPLNELVDQCIKESHAKQSRLKALHRPIATFFLSQYFLHTMDIAGARAECGVFAGTSALLLCRTAQTRIPDYKGMDFHLIDSFEGLSEPSEKDVFPTAEPGDPLARGLSWHKGGYASPLYHARKTLQEFPEVSFHAGWIPAILTQLPDTHWSFVHLDVDLYAPTLDCLAYFYPRLNTGGVIVCDDYGAPLFPGAHRAWDEFCEQRDLPYVVLDTGQSVIVKT